MKNANSRFWSELIEQRKTSRIKIDSIFCDTTEIAFFKM